MINEDRNSPGAMAGAMAVAGPLLQLGWTTVQAEPTSEAPSAYDAWSVIAAEADGVPQYVVAHDDLDLAEAADIKRLIGRIKAAAQDVCERQDIAALKRLRQQRECEDVAFNHSMKQVSVLIRATRFARR